MKVTFIQPYYKNIWEALGPGSIIAYAKKHHKGDLEINFYQGHFDDDAEIIEGTKDSDIVAFSCTSPTYAHGLRLASALKNLNPRIHTVFGGWHPSALPGVVINEWCVDQVVIGEGEQIFLGILNGDRTPVLQGAGQHYPLEWPDRATVRNDRTVDLCEKMNGRRTASFQCSRGCLVHCAFCSEITMSGKYNRSRNPIRSRPFDDVCDEIEAVQRKYDIDYFKFTDATFDINPDHVINFCKTLIDYELNIDWECQIHAGFVQKEEVFEWLKKANCNQINIGCESGSPRILKDIGKGINIKSLINVFEWARKYEIQRRGFFILGMPNEEYQDIQYTEDFIDHVQPDVVGFTILCPYPGSDLYNHDKFKDIDWENTDEYSNDFWSTKYLTNEDLKEVQQYMKNKYKDILCERQGDKVCLNT